MPLFYTDRYIKRNCVGQEFFTDRYEIFFRRIIYPGHIARLVSTSASSLGLGRPASGLDRHTLDDRTG